MEVEEIYNPFPGLRAFEEDEEYLFFGREKQIDELLTKLRLTRFLAVVGESGSGKSSLIKSGLLPSLYGGYMSGVGAGWRVALMRPGGDPIGNLAQALAQPGVLYSDDEDMQAMYVRIVESTLRRSTEGLNEAIKQARLPEHENILVVVDQFEELFRFSELEKNQGSSQRDSISFINLLLESSTNRSVPVYVVLTMRSDFLGNCSAFQGLPEAINTGQYLVPRMTRQQQKEAIEGPILVGGASITPRLVNQLLNDIGDNPDQLPILQHALMRTWDYWVSEGKPEEPLDSPHYEAIGTMKEALSQHAEEAFAELKTKGQKTLCEQLFRQLTEKNKSGKGIRRPSKLGTLCELTTASEKEVMKIIEVFRKQGRSFLMPPDHIPLDAETVIDISHESLMRIWKRLIEWSEEEAQSVELYLQLAESADLYRQKKKGLWRDPELQLGLIWYEKHSVSALWAARFDFPFEDTIAYLMQSKKQRETEVREKQARERAKIRRTRIFATVLGVAAFVSVLLSLWAFDNRKKAIKSAEQARKESIRAEKNATVAQVAKERADENAEVALKNEQVAKENANKAAQNARIAQRNADDASRARARAERNAEEARKQKDRAKESEKEALIAKSTAEKERETAVRQEKKAERLYMLSEAKALANKALKILNDGDKTTAAQLALYSFCINRNYQGAQQVQEIRQALDHSLATVAPSQENTRQVHGNGVRALAYHPKQRLFASAGNDKKLFLWKKKAGQTPEVQHAFQVPFQPDQVLFSPDGQNLFATLADGSLIQWDNYFDKGSKYRVVDQHERPIHSLAFTTFEDHSFILAVSASQVAFYTFAGQKVQLQKRLETEGVAVAALGNYKGKIYLALGYKKELELVRIDLKKATMQAVKRFALNRTITALSFSHKGSYLAAGTGTGYIELFDMDRLETFTTLLGHRLYITQLAFSPDDRQLASASLDKSARLWLFREGDKEEPFILNHPSWIQSLTYDHSGHTLLTAGEDGLIHFRSTKQELLAKNLCNYVTVPLSPEKIKDYIPAGPSQAIRVCDF